MGADLTGTDLGEDKLNGETTPSGVSHKWVSWNGTCPMPNS
jgi:hypothetical protein